jgi:hypothetical protein
MIGGIAGSNPVEGMDIGPLCLLCVVWGSADSCRGVQRCVCVCVCVYVCVRGRARNLCVIQIVWLFRTDVYSARSEITVAGC